MFKITLENEVVVAIEFQDVDAAILFLNQRDLSARWALIEHKLTGYSVRAEKHDTWVLIEGRRF